VGKPGGTVYGVRAQHGRRAVARGSGCPVQLVAALMEGIFCFEDDYVGCVCGWCHMTEDQMRESLGDPPAEDLQANDENREEEKQ
jgi:hypothetical protein